MNILDLEFIIFSLNDNNLNVLLDGLELSNITMKEINLKFISKYITNKGVNLVSKWF